MTTMIILMTSLSKIVQMSSYYDDDSLNNLFKDKGNSFCILSLNCQSINANFDQLNNKVQQLMSNNNNNNNNNNGRNGSYLTWLATSLEERPRWPIINASPRGQCSK